MALMNHPQQKNRKEGGICPGQVKKFCTNLREKTVGFRGIQTQNDEVEVEHIGQLTTTITTRPSFRYVNKYLWKRP